MTTDDITVVGETNYRSQKRRFGIKVDDRRRHMYLIGKTGMGKSTTMENMIIEDIRNGKGVCVVDPHGDLVEKIVDYIPTERINDVVYFNPYDYEYPIAFNVLETVDDTQRYLVASGMIGVFKKIWVDSWGPRLEYLLRNTILALLEYPGSTMLGITRMLINKAFRKKVVDAVRDPIIKTFWLDEFETYSNQFRTEALSPIQNKVGQFLSSSIMRNILGQTKSTIDLRDIMDNKKILLLNLSKGRIGEDNSSLLGAMMITKIQLAAMSRIDILEKDRIDFYLYVDEFQNFATESFEAILSEARKFRLNLIIAHQYIEQLEEGVQYAVFGNVGTLMCFRVGAADAEFLEKEFEPTFMMNDLVNLTKFEVYLKLMIDGVASEPFSANSLPPFPEEEKTGNREKVIRVSREHYSRPRQVVEEKIIRFSNLEQIMERSNANDDSPRPRPSRSSSSDQPRPSSNVDDRPRPSVSPERPQPKMTEMKPVVPDPPPAISLKAAIQNNTSTFSGKRPPRNRNASRGRRDDRDQGGNRREQQPQRNIEQRRPSNEQHTVLHPGEAVHPSSQNGQEKL